MNKNINDGTHSQGSGIHKDHGPWVTGTHKEANNFESLYFHYISMVEHKTIVTPLLMHLSYRRL